MLEASLVNLNKKRLAALGAKSSLSLEMKGYVLTIKLKFFPDGYRHMEESLLIDLEMMAYAKTPCLEDHIHKMILSMVEEFKRLEDLQ